MPGKLLGHLTIFAFSLCSSWASAEVFWIDVSETDAEKAALQKSKVNAPSNYRLLGVDMIGLRSYLGDATQGQSDAILTLPSPDGGSIDFIISRSNLLSPELSKKFPNLIAYRGYSASNPVISISLEVTTNGLTAQVLEPGNRWIIDPVLRGDSSRAMSYFAHDLRIHDHSRCLVEGSGRSSVSASQRLLSTVNNEHSARSSGDTLRSYRLAVATTGEYTVYHGGTKESALSAVVTTMNRVDGIYRKEMAITFELVGNNDDIIFVDPATDQFEGNNNASTLINESQTVIDAYIGTANYDIGHTFSTGAGGVAQLASVCGTNKARGVTGSSTPEADPYDVDYVAHEIGHQFGGYHTFNSAVCASNRTGSSAYEPGGGTTIQAYAGICGSDNIQANSDPMFHSHSFDQMYGFASEGAGDSCALKTSLSNSSPTANAGSDFTVPIGTPLVVSGSGSDSDGDSLQYSWEQFDLGESALLTAADDGSIPLFRAQPPKDEAVRYLPALQSVVDGSTSCMGQANAPGCVEKLPTRQRDMNMRLTVRDNAGGVAYDDSIISVSSDAGPFQLIEPNGGDSVTSSKVISWDVAGTDGAPVNTTEVEFSLSMDGGQTFSIDLGSSTNDGFTTLTFPEGVSSTQARLMIKGKNNIFYDISDQDFIIDSSLPPVEPPTPSLQSISALVNSVRLEFTAGVDNGVTPDSYEAACFTPDTFSTVGNYAAPGSTLDGSEVVESSITMTDDGIVEEDGPEISVNITHEYRGDIRLDLISPSGTEVRIKDSSLSDSQDDVVGTFPTTLAPANSLSAFAGEPIAGDWTLRVTDTYPSLDDGVFNEWAISFIKTTSGLNSTVNGSSSPIVVTDMTPGETYTCTLRAVKGVYSSETVSAGELVPLEVALTDADEDGIDDASDNCPQISNEDQADFDSDGLGNVCDADDDNDGTADTDDAFPFDNTETLDTDGDGIGNNEDYDDDGDGTIDSFDSQPLTANTFVIDSDGDGVADSVDAFPQDPNQQFSGDGDLDGDGWSNDEEVDYCSNPFNSDSQPNMGGLNPAILNILSEGT